MRAARYYGKGDIRVEEIDEPVCRAGQVKIKPAFVGICGSDLHEYLIGPLGTPVIPHKVTNETLPITLGHEFSGTVIEVGAGVTEIQVGQKVAVQPSIYDGTCSACYRGLENLCDNFGFVGVSGWGGGLSDAVTVPARSVFLLPENIPLEIGALVEPLSVGWHAVSQSQLQKDSRVLILGGGPIGISVILALRARGCRDIIVSEPSTARQISAKHFGADHVIDPTKEVALFQTVKELTGGDGVDIVFDCAGVPAALEAACRSIAARGTLINVAVWENATLFQPNYLMAKEGRYISSFSYVKQDFKDVINAIASGAIKPENMITKKISLENVVEEGIKMLISDKENQVKILVQI